MNNEIQFEIKFEIQFGTAMSIWYRYEIKFGAAMKEQ